MTIPKEVKLVIETLEKNKFEAFIVGGCVRDILRGKEPKDWDVATSAKPEEVKKIFPESFYENKFLTVTVLTKSKKDSLKNIEVTTYRQETQYTDKRHPDEVKVAKNLEEDLARRDFTINAIALNTKKEIVDPFRGQQDLNKKIIRAVGNPKERFAEDALRMMRAVRFAAVLGEGWKIEEETSKAIKENAASLENISKERIRDEFQKMIMSDKAADGVEMLRELGLLKYIIPELEEGYKVGQNKHHIYECYEHSLKSLDYAAKQGFTMEVRVAALLHDVGKPRSKRGEGKDSTFYNHETIGAKMASVILERLKFPRKEADKIVLLVKHHLFYYNVGEVTESSIRRLVRQVSPENMEDLLRVRMSDRIGSGVPKAEPYKLRHLRYLIDKVSQDPISAKMLKVSGNDVMKQLKIQPSRKIGQILEILLDEVLSDPKKNNRIHLQKEILKLGKLSEAELEKLAQKAKKQKEGLEIKKDEMTKKKYWVV